MVIKIGYLHIDNLYKNVEILLFKECYAMEKIHGTSAHISFKYEENKIIFFSGGEKHDKFIKLFDEETLLQKFKESFNCNVTIFGEAYGGKCQAMSDTYGKELKFVAFDVKVENYWLDVPNAEEVVTKLGLEFVDYVKITTDLVLIDAERDKPSTQAIRNGCGNDRMREGVVLRPLIEVTKNNGGRIISKHKGDKFLETRTKREVNPDRLELLKDAEAISIEWVTPMRLEHVLDKLRLPELDVKYTGDVIRAMLEDVFREAKGEIVESAEAKRAIGHLTAKIYKQKISKI